MSLRTRYRRALRLVVVWMGRMMHTRNFSMAFSRFLSELSPAVNMLNILICVVCYMQVLEAQVSGCTSVSHTNLQRSTGCKVYTSSQYVKYQGIGHFNTPTLEVELSLHQQTFHQSARQNSTLACLVNCSSISNKCVDQSICISCNQELVSNSMITVALTFGTKYLARCFGESEFLEANQTPLVTFTTDESGTAILHCSFVLRTVKASTTHVGYSSWKYIAPGLVSGLAICLVLLALVLKWKRRIRRSEDQPNQHGNSHDVVT